MTPEDTLAAMGSVITDLFYWVSIALMMLIHAGFLAYECGASRVEERAGHRDEEPAHLRRRRRHRSSSSAGSSTTHSRPGLRRASTSPERPRTCRGATTWVRRTDSVSGIFWGAFALFAATTGSIMSGAVLERIRTSGFLILTDGASARWCGSSAPPGAGTGGLDAHQVGVPRRRRGRLRAHGRRLLRRWAS